MTNFGTSRCLLGAAAIVWLLAALVSAAAAGSTVAEVGQVSVGGASSVQQASEKPASAPAAAPAPPSQAAAADKPGFLRQLGQWWEQSIAGFNTKMEDAWKTLDGLRHQPTDAANSVTAVTQEAVKNAAEATTNAATAIVRLPSTRVIETRERCATAANGAPDCQAAAANACRGKGFATGQPLDVRSADKCATTMWLSGKKSGDGDCPSETVVTRAVCQ